MRRQELHPRTAIINKKQKNQSKLARFEALNWLAAKFPQAFDNTARIQPLKSGIMAEILAYADEAAEAGISKSKLREAVIVFTRRVDYLTALKAREKRIDLFGAVVGSVTEDEAERAAVKIKRRVENSAKNARKTLSTKAFHYPSQKSSAYGQTDSESPHYYSESSSSYNKVGSSASAPKASSIVVKHKTTRQYDPDAVARLKERLGLASKKEAQEISE